MLSGVQQGLLTGIFGKIAEIASIGRTLREARRDLSIVVALSSEAESARESFQFELYTLGLLLLISSLRQRLASLREDLDLEIRLLANTL